MAERSIEVETLLSAIRSRRLHRFLMITTSVLLLLFGGCYFTEGPPFYSSDPIRIRVVDEQTGQPVPGAVALAWWVGISDLGDGGNYMHAAEAVSDQNGWLTLSGWRIVRPWFYAMTNQDPLIRIYKPGSYAALDNGEAHPRAGSDSWTINRFAFWDGKTVQLIRLKTAAEEARAIDSLISVTRLKSNRAREVDPIRFPHIWEAMAAGYSRLSAEQRAAMSDPIGIRRDYRR